MNKILLFAVTTILTLFIGLVSFSQCRCDDGNPATCDTEYLDSITNTYKCAHFFDPNRCGGLSTWYKDADGDGYYTSKITTQSCPGSGWTINPGLGGGDCNDSNPAIYPNAVEICGNGIDENCNGSSDDACINNVIQDIRIDSIRGKLIINPLKDVIVKAYRGNDLIATTVSDSRGNFLFANLDPNLFYTLKFHYQDADGINDNVFVDYEYTGFKPGMPTDDILLPYTMLRQTRYLFKKILTKDNYEIKYLLDFLDLNKITAQNRKTYDLELLKNLIDDWQTIDKIEAKDVIDNLGRVYITLFAMDEFSEDAYKLSKLPAKAVSGVLEVLFGYLKIAEKLNKIIENQDNSLGFVIDDMTDLVDDAIYSVISLALKEAKNILDVRLETVTDPEEQEFIKDLKKKIELASLVLTTTHNRIDGEIEILQGLVKDIINNNIFIYLFERHISKTQDLITNVYNRARLLAPPEETFEAAMTRVMIDNNSSLVSTAHANTELVIDECDSLYFKNVETLDKVLEVTKTIDDLSKLTSGTNIISKASTILKKVSFLFDLFKIGNYGLALYTSLDRLGQNRNEQMDVPRLSFSPSARIADRQSYIARSFLINDLQPELNSYNKKLDTIIQLIQNHQNLNAALKAKELRTQDSILNFHLNYTSKKIQAIAGFAINSISDFDNLYLNNFVVPYHNTFFIRTGMIFNLATWFLDTTATSFVDTLTQLASKTKIYNQQINDAIVYIDNLTFNVQIPVKVSVTAISGPNEISKDASTQIKISYQNFGNDIAKDVKIQLQADAGFLLSPDVLNIGDIAPGAAGEVTFQISSPFKDTFTVYSVTLKAANGKGDNAIDYLISRNPEICNGIDDDNDGLIDNGLRKNYFLDSDGDGYGNSTNGLRTCTRPVGYVTNNTDCDDINKNIHPGAEEICGNGIDDNCNNLIDENCNTDLPQLQMRTYPVKEGNTGYSKYDIKVTLDRPAVLPVQINYHTSDGEAIAGLDYLPVHGILAIPPGLSSGTISVRIIGDLLRENNERFHLNFGDPINVTFSSTHQSSILIIDDDKGNKNGFNSNADVTIKENEFKQEKSSMRYDLYPNPADQKVNFKLGNEIGYEKLNIQIIDQNGKIVNRIDQSFSNESQFITISTKYLLNGMYYILIRDYNGKQVSAKIIVHH